jgi:hypothetical protein
MGKVDFSGTISYAKPFIPALIERIIIHYIGYGQNRLWTKIPFCGIMQTKRGNRQSLHRTAEPVAGLVR